MYAIVRCGGRQEKASVDDVLTVDQLTGEVGSTLMLPAVLVVDGDQVVTDPEQLGGYEVAAEIIGAVRGPKINMIRYKNKTGYRRRLGHRQRYTQLRVTAITKPGATAKASSAKAGTAKASSAKASSAKTSTAEASSTRTGSGKDTAAAAKPAARTRPAAKAAAGGDAETPKES